MGRKIHINENKAKYVLGDGFDTSRKMFFPNAELAFNKPWTYADYRLTEGLVRTYPFESMKRHMLGYMNIPSYYFHEIEDDGIKRAAIDIPTERIGMKDDVERCMSTFGYFICQVRKYTDFIRQIYEPRFQNDDVNKEEGDFLYHITSLNNFTKIMAIGLKPNSNNVTFNYPDRIYLLSSDAEEEHLIETALMLRDTHKEPRNKHGKYRRMPNNMWVIAKVFLDKLSKDIEFHKDINYGPYGLYTTSNIPPDAIELDNVINLDKL